MVEEKQPQIPPRSLRDDEAGGRDDKAVEARVRVGMVKAAKKAIR